MSFCLYNCNSGADSTQEYHVLPESAANVSLTLPTGIVCDKCNCYFAKLENYFIQRHPGSAQRLMRLEKTKKGKHPKFQSKAGEVTRTITNGQLSVQMNVSDIQFENLDNGDLIIKTKTACEQFDATKISRVLGKIALETLWLVYGKGKVAPLAETYTGLRDYVRFGRGKLNFLSFSYRVGDYPDRLPGIGPLQNEDGKPLGHGCMIFLPGIWYFVALPPWENQLTSTNEGWKSITEPGKYPVEDLTANVKFVSVKP